MTSAPSSLLIRGARVYRGVDSAASPPFADILIRDGRIAEIADAGTPPTPAMEQADRIVDGRGKLVIPGLVNAHYHSHDVLARGLFEDLPLEIWIALAIPGPRQVGNAEVRLRTLLGAAECLLAGITTIQDMVGTGPGAEEHVEIIRDAYRESGIRCVLSLQVGNRPSLDCLPGLEPELPAELHALLRPPQAAAGRILDFVAAPLRATAQPRLTWAIGPGSPQRCTADLLEGLAGLSETHDLPVVTHVNESKLQVFLGREQCAAHGGSWVDYLKATGLLTDRLTIAHGIWLDDREIELIAASGAAVATNPTSNLKLKAGIAPLRKLRRAGVPLAVGCDNTSAGDAQNLFQAMKLMCTLNAAKGPDDAGITAAVAFDAATQGGATALRLGRDIGSIEIGKKADLTLLDLDDLAYVPLNHAIRQIVYSEGGRGVHTVIVDGAVVVEAGKLKTIDLAALRGEIETVARTYVADLDAHAARMAPVLPYIARTAARMGALPLDFSRWSSAPGATD